MATVESVTAKLLRVPLPATMTGFGYTHINVPFVTVTDSDGASGTGFTYTLDTGASIVCRMVEDVIAPRLFGRPLEAWENVFAAITRETRRLGATTFTPALSALDIAVWDLRGIRAGVPLYELLGGAPRDIAFYGSGRGGQNLSVAELVESSIRYLADGYCGVKLAVGALEPAVDLARVRAVREAIGDAQLMVDASERLNLDEALYLGAGLDELDLAWFEEPMLAEDVSGYAALATRLSTPIATGEHWQGRAPFERYLSETAVSFYQPDVALGGGVTEMLAIAALAAEHDRPISWHSLADLHLHIAVATDATHYVEDFPILDLLMTEPLRPVDGVARVTGRPGHGMTWDSEAIAAYDA